MSLADVLRLLSQLPATAQVPVGWVREQLQDAGAEVSDGGAPDPAGAAATWREKLWTVPDETRLGTLELAEALGRPESWVHRHCSKASGYELLPHAKLDGARVFKAGEIRAWLKEHEEVIAKPATPVVAITRGRKAVR